MCVLRSSSSQVSVCVRVHVSCMRYNLRAFAPRETKTQSTECRMYLRQLQPAVSLLPISTTSSPHNDQRDKRGHVSANYCKSALASKGVPRCLLPGRTAHRRLSSSLSSPVQRSHCLAQSSHRHPVRCSTRRRPPRVSCASRCGRYLRSGAVRRGYQHRRGARA